MKKLIATVGFLAILGISFASAYATCGTTGDGCTTLPPPPPIGSCVGPCGGTFSSNGFMNVKMDASSYANTIGDGPGEVQQFSGGTYDLKTKFNLTGLPVETTGEINMMGGFQAAKIGPGSTYGGASGLTKWSTMTSFGTKPVYNAAVILPTTFQ